MKKINLLTRMGLFAAILSLGTLAALTVGEARGLALADLSGAPVRAMATVAHGDVLYAALPGGRQPAGIYRSEDRGDTWQRTGSGPGAAIRALAMSRPELPGFRPLVECCMFLTYSRDSSRRSRRRRPSPCRRDR